MRIDRIPVSEINPTGVNPRVDLAPTDPEYQQIQRSIDRWSLVEPLVWNVRTKRLVSGHQRLKVLVDRGETEVDVSVVDLDENDEQALGIALNKISGRWDNDQLAEALSKLDASGLDVTLTGFSPDDLGTLVQDVSTLFVPKEPDPILASRTVGASDIAAAEARQQERFSGTVSRKVRTVACPHCGHEFGLSQ